MADSLPDTFSEQPPLTPAEPIALPPSRRAVKSSVLWVTASFGASLCIRLGSNVILAYLLEPRAFGLFALTYVFICGLHSFSDIGIRVSIIHSPRGDNQAFLDTAWTVQVVRGFLVWLGAILLAWPVAYLRPTPEPDLLWLLPLIGFCAVIEGFISTKQHLLYRHLQQRRAVTIDFISSTAGTVVMVCLVYLSPSLLALASGPLTSSTLNLVLSHLLKGPRNRFRRDPEASRELVHFGRWIFLSTMFAYLADQADRFVVGLISVTTLGVYHLANQIATIPSTLLGTMARQVFMPLYSRLNDSKRDLRPAVRSVQIRAGLAVVLLIGGLIATGPTLVRCLYDPRYEAATWILPLLAVVCMVQIFDANAGNLLIARGRPRTYAFSNLAKALSLALLMPIGVHFDGVRGLIIALLVSETARYVRTGWALRQDGLGVFRRDVFFAVCAVALGLVAHFLGAAAHPAMPASETRDWGALLTRLAIESGVAIGGWLVLAGIAWQAGWLHSLPEDKESARRLKSEQDVS